MIIAIRSLSTMFVVLATLLVRVSDASAQTEKRIALVITNQAYSTEVGVLDNTHKDGEMMVAALRAARFDLPDSRVVRDADKARFEAAIRDYILRMADAGQDAVGVLYYSGHGAADKVDGQNYAIPVDARIESAADLPTRAVELRWMVNKLIETRAKANFVFFDACRNVVPDPAKKSLLTHKGLKPERITSDSGEKKNMVLFFATTAGRTVPDNNLFSTVLSAEIRRTPGTTHSDFIWNVREQVKKKSDRELMPYIDEDLENRFFFQPPAEAGTAPAASMPEARGAPTTRTEPSQPRPSEAFVQVLKKADKGSIYFPAQARIYAQPNRQSQSQVLAAGTELTTPIELGETATGGTWYKFVDNFDRPAFVRHVDAHGTFE